MSVNLLCALSLSPTQRLLVVEMMDGEKGMMRNDHDVDTATSFIPAAGAGAGTEGGVTDAVKETSEPHKVEANGDAGDQDHGHPHTEPPKTNRSSPTKRKRRRRRVIVIGSGMAGLCAARELQHRGYSILIVEAQNRLGGRLKSYEMHCGTSSTGSSNSNSSNRNSSSNDTASNGSGNANHTTSNTGTNTTGSNKNTVPIDIGGALIHGIVDNPIHTLVHTDMKIPTCPLLSDDCLLLSNNGWPVDVQHDKHISQLFNDCLTETFTRIEQIHNAKGSNSSNNNDNDNKKTKNDITEKASFGDLFDQVCQQRNVNTKIPLFRWYQANLELSSGTTFDNLGYTWNDDEPYGYDGDHVAITSPWKSVCTTLGETLYVLYNSPVTNVHVVYPDPKELEQQEQRQQQQQDRIHEPSLDTPVERPSKKQRRTASNKSTLPLKQSPFEVSIALPQLRQSKRIRGEAATLVRRSNRSNKGQLSVTTTGGTSTNTASTTKRSRNEISSNTSSNASSSVWKEVKTTVQVTLKSGVTLEADAVVCTIPLGVLKEGSVTFDPPLPLPKQLAIQQLGSGLFNKCAMTFTKQFWQNSDFLGMVDSQRSYLILNASKYTGKPVLLFLYGGAFAKEIEEWTDHDVVNDCLAILRRICGRECVTAPIDYHVTRWGKDPYSRMSFTYVPSGVDGLSEFKAMSQPIYDHTGTIPVLMFAGEHTTPYHPSTIHGAYLSGIREAYRLDCALEPEGNNFLDFTEENIYERTFVIKRKSKDTPVMQNGSNVATTMASDADAVTDAPSRAQYPKNTIQSYQRRRRNVRDGMTLRRRPKSYFSLNISNSRKKDDKRGVAPSGPSLVLDKATGTILSNTSSPMPTRRSERTNTDSSPAPVEPASAAKAMSTKPSLGTITSPSRRSQRTTSTKVVLSNGNSVRVLPDAVPSSSSLNNDMIAVGAEDPFATTESILRERRALENRVLMRGLESYGPDYDYIVKSAIPIYQNVNNHTTGLSDDIAAINRQQLEQRCVKLSRKNQRLNAQREAAVLHYHKSWIATNIAVPASKIKTRADIPNGKAATKLHVFAVSPSREAAAHITKTRSGRTSKRPATVLLS